MADKCFFCFGRKYYRRKTGRKYYYIYIVKPNSSFNDGFTVITGCDDFATNSFSNNCSTTTRHSNIIVAYKVASQTLRHNYVTTIRTLFTTRPSRVVVISDLDCTRYWANLNINRKRMVYILKVDLWLLLVVITH